MNTSSERISTHCEINLIMAANFQLDAILLSQIISVGLRSFQIVMEKLRLWFRNTKSNEL